MIVLFIGLAILCIIASKMINRNVERVKTKYKIQDGKITYSDLNIPEKPFFSPRYRITGKPDYIVKKKNHYVPVEVKTGWHHEPQKNHTFQLATYCQLLEDTYGGLVPYGMLIYSDTSQQYMIPFDPKLRFELESIVKRMRKELKTGKIIRNHQDPHRCKSCSMRTYCKMKII